MDQIFTIRDFHSNDFETLEELWVLTGMAGKERGDDIGVIQDTIDSGGKLLVMINQSGKLIGSSWLSHDQRRMYIHHFAIHPDFQGRGLSKTLMDRSMEYCRSVGLQVKLEVHCSNQRAINLYKSYGFSKLEGYEVQIIRNI